MIILGSSSGISQEILKELNKDYDIICLYNNTKPLKFKKAKYLKANLNKITEVKKTIIKLKKKIINEKKIILLNFSSVKIDKISINIKKAELLKTFNINFFSFFYIIQGVLPIMLKKKWGRIINFSSTGGAAGEIGTLLYTTSKNASMAMIRIMAKEYAKFNINFNTIKLGNFNVGMYKKLPPKVKNKILKAIPNEKTGNKNNILNAIKFIVNSDYVNGSEVSVDGGYEVN